MLINDTSQFVCLTNLIYGSTEWLWWAGHRVAEACVPTAHEVPVGAGVPRGGVVGPDDAAAPRPPRLR
eukprot:COSAG01_NODE_26043_length_725_cov_0.889776_2_plen_67_part_01